MVEEVRWDYTHDLRFTVVDVGVDTHYVGHCRSIKLEEWLRF